MPFEQLLAPRWSRSIVSASLSTPAAEGAIHIESLIQTIAAARPIMRVPRRELPTLRRGVQVIVDAGTGMLPFARDQEALVAELLRVVGEHRVEIHTVSSPPTVGEGDGRWQGRRGWERCS